jgi:hypothetical protein
VSQDSNPGVHPQLQTTPEEGQTTLEQHTSEQSKLEEGAVEKKGVAEKEKSPELQAMPVSDDCIVDDCILEDDDEDDFYANGEDDELVEMTRIPELP